MENERAWKIRGPAAIKNTAKEHPKPEQLFLPTMENPASLLGYVRGTEAAELFARARSFNLSKYLINYEGRRVNRRSLRLDAELLALGKERIDADTWFKLRDAQALLAPARGRNMKSTVDSRQAARDIIIRHLIETYRH